MKTIRILPSNIHDSWLEFLNDSKLKELSLIDEKIRGEFNPPADKVLRFMLNNLNSMKVIILGQDPYPERGKAIGRAFEVGGLESWEDKFKQVSLKNIVRMVYKTYKRIEKYEEIKTFNQIKTEIRSGDFPILPPNKLFKSWEDQGVLLLNSYLTCETGNPGSHRDIWERFAKDLTCYIAAKRPDMVWILWGKDANTFRKHITSGIIYSSRHPMMCSGEYLDDFLKSDCFKATMDVIQWLGK